MDTLKLLITDNNLLLSEKGNLLLEKTFESDEESIQLLDPILKKKNKSRIDCFFSGNRLVSQSRIVSYDAKEYFVADEKTLQGLVDSASHSFLEEHKDVKLEIIQTGILGIFLNGYRVKEIGKQKVKDMTVSVFLAAMPAGYKKQFKKNVSFYSFAWHSTERIKKISKEEEFVVCSAYERSTDISIKKADGFFETLSIPLGTHHIKDNKETFKKNLEEEIGKGLIGLSEGICLPGHVYLLVASEFQDIFEGAFKSDTYHSMCFSEKGFEVTNMSSILNS